MSLNWSWKNKVGYIVIENQEQIKLNFPEYRVTLYEGNAPFIAISEWKNDKGTDMYMPFTFFSDEEHAKRCLGLAKDSDYILDGIKEIHLDIGEILTDKRLEKIVKLWMKAIVKHGLNITITLEDLHSDVNM